MSIRAILSDVSELEGVISRFPSFADFMPVNEAGSARKIIRRRFPRIIIINSTLFHFCNALRYERGRLALRAFMPKTGKAIAIDKSVNASTSKSINPLVGSG